jgi:acyl-CoA oxidase
MSQRIRHSCLFSGQFCLTELGHGLDAFNLETTASVLPDGGFLLHTPTPQAAK